MSAIANFKKRRLAEKAKQGEQQVKPTTALALLATLLGCDESKAIETAQQYVDQNITFFCEDATDELNQSINTASNSAGDIESAAEQASNAASDLAYQADDINAANSDLKDTVEELKKPSAAPKSSNSKSKTKQKNSSKK